MAAGFLTVLQACSHLHSHENICLEKFKLEHFDILVECTREVVPECLHSLSDGIGLKLMHLGAVNLPCGTSVAFAHQAAKARWIEQVALEEVINADDSDLARLKLRMLVLAHRRCGNLKCTTLRPSNDKPFGKFCAGCKIMEYCSEKCQIEDLNSGHKEVCKQFEAQRSGKTKKRRKK